MPILHLPTHDITYDIRGEGLPVLLLGGSGEPMIAWEFCGLVDALAESGHQVIWYAARGVAPSGCPPLPWTTGSMAEDALALLDLLGLDSVLGVGYSLGGFTLEEVVHRAPNRISGAVLLASAGAHASKAGVIREAFITAENACAERWGEVPREFSRLTTLMTCLGGAELTDPALVSQWWELLAHQHDQWAQPHGEVGQAQVARSWVASGSSTGRAWPDVPTTLIHFEHDPLFPPDEATRLASALGDAGVRVIPEAGHGGLITRPEPTIAAILDTLATLTAARGLNEPHH